MGLPRRKVEPERQERRESMVEQIHGQLFRFLDAVHEIKTELAEDPEFTLEDAMYIVKNYKFLPRQEKYFKELGVYRPKRLKNGGILAT